MNCKQASQLISRNLDSGVSMRDRVALKFHLLLCKYCSRFSQQLTALNVAISSMRQNIEDDSNIKLPSEAKKRIVKSLEPKD